jgi:2-iminoacetate synthase
MSFVSEFNRLDVAGLVDLAKRSGRGEVASALARPAGKRDLADFAALISPAAGEKSFLEEMARQSHELTVRYFGRVVRLFAPLYLSNECINICKYCGFSRDNPILRVTLTREQIRSEARYLFEEGFRHILLVAGEHPAFVSQTYLQDCVGELRQDWPSISLEVGPMETAEYAPIVQAGAEGLVVYQETYDRTVYDEMHIGGPKRNFDWRLETAERGYEAGFKRLGIGALLGLADWRWEAVSVAVHARYLLRKCWQSALTVSVPRIRPSAGEFQPLVHVTDREMVQFVSALRLTFPEVGIVLSTRESARLRDGLVPLGITMMSAGSHTEPGGYTGQGKEALHLTKGGRFVRPDHPHIESEGEHATVQFQISDNRSASEVATVLSRLGYEPVWKDWETTLNEHRDG